MSPPVVIIERCVCLNGAVVELLAQGKQYSVETVAGDAEWWEGPEESLAVAYRLFNAAVDKAMVSHKHPTTNEWS